MLKYQFRKLELFIVEIPVNKLIIISIIELSFLFSSLASNLQTAYIEFNTVQEAEQWMTLTQVQTKKPKYSIILVSIYWWECRLCFNGRQNMHIDTHNYNRRDFIWTLESIVTVHFHSGYISSQRSSCYIETSIRRRFIIDKYQ